MRTLLSICFLLITFSAVAQQGPGITYLTAKNLPATLKKNWVFHGGDDTAWAAIDYNDTAWNQLSPELHLTKKGEKKFNGIGWFRLHIHIDSNVADFPISLTMSHYGASEIYIDGVRIQSYGEIGSGKDSTEEYNPNKIPLPIKSLDTGMHVIAVRYSNYYAEEMWEAYGETMAGFQLTINKADDFLTQYLIQLALLGVVCLSLFGFFLALALSHFLLWLYYKATRSNLYFSIFCFGLSFVFLIPCLARMIHNPEWERVSAYLAMIAAVAITVSLSGVSNELFSERKLRFRIIAAICLLPIVLSIFNLETAAYSYIGIMVLVTIESIALTIHSIYNKKPGARIVGVGILFFTLFIFTMLAISALNNGNLSVSEGWAALMLISLTIAAILSIPISMSIYLAWSFAHLTKNLDKQLHQVQLLSAKTLEQELEKQKMLENRQEELEAEVAERTEELAKQHEELKLEKHKSDELLRNILPEEVAAELKLNGTSEAKYFDHVSVIFTDFVGFTKAGERMTPQQLVDELHTCFKAFDDIISKYNIEKIKTIGDAYLAVCGLPAVDTNHAVSTVRAALEIRKFMNVRKLVLQDKTFDIRIGVHSGAVVAGIVGVKKFAYDIWGDTVNTAARMEQSSLPDKINISQTTYELVKDYFICTYRGEIAAKNKGDMNMYFVDGERT